MNLLTQAAHRLGFKDVELPEDALAFDESLYLGRWPAREPRIVLVDGGFDQSLVGRLNDLGFRAELACPEDPQRRVQMLLRAKVALASMPTGEVTRGAIEAASARCLVAVLSDVNCDDFVRLGSTSTDISIIAALLRGLLGGNTRDTLHATENLRRKMTARYGSCVRAVQQMPDLMRRFTEHVQAYPRARDAYQWENERLLLAAALMPLAVDGAVVEVGVGSGGTTSVLANFANGRPVFAFDNFSYGGAEQKEEFRATMRSFGYTLVEGKSNSTDHPDLKQIAFLHIDGGHDEGDCASDLARFAMRIVPGGILAVDDYLTKEDQQGVVAATDAFLESMRGLWAPITCAGKLALWRRIDPTSPPPPSESVPEPVPVPSPESVDETRT